MQQEQVIGEITEHIGDNPGHESDEQTLLYLQALHNLFERGILNHGRIYQMDSSMHSH